MKEKSECRLLIHYKKCEFCNKHYTYNLRSSNNQRLELMSSTGVTINRGINYPLYVHQCEGCGNTKYFNREYPYAERKQIV